MRTLRSGHSSQLPKPPISAAIGVFDGVHLGHRAILRAAIHHARQYGGSAVAVTFHPHPQTVLAPEKSLRLIQTFEERLKCLEIIGVDAVYVVDFNQAFRENPPEAFLDELKSQLGPLDFISVGSEFRFGKNRSGNLNFLRETGQVDGFQVEGLELLQWNKKIISSTLIRSMIASGQLTLAGELLGRTYCIASKVEHGDHLGAQLGYPTANLDTENLITPPHGVYHGQVYLENGHSYHAAVNIGMRPTLKKNLPTLRVEAHLLDFEGDLYGQRLEIMFIEKIREEKSFPGLDSLKAQIATDIQEIRRRVAGK